MFATILSALIFQIMGMEPATHHLTDFLHPISAYPVEEYACFTVPNIVMQQV
jgi:hypothetical protein